jgi:hypothetical protein
MNICIRQIGVVCLLFLFSAGVAHGQAGFNIKFGLETWSLKDEIDQSGVSKHPGQMIGFDVFVEDNRFLFVPGFHYHRISLANEDKSFSLDFDEAHHAHYFMIPLTIGYKVLEIPSIELAILGGAEVNFFYDIDDNDLALEDNMFYGVSTNLTGSLHVTFFSILTTEVKYHYALQPILKIRDDSKLRGWTLAAGLKF